MVHHSYEFYISSLQTGSNTITVNIGRQNAQKDVPLCYYLEQEKVLFFLLAPSPY